MATRTWQERKADLKQQLHAAGVWDRFVTLREELKSQGLAPQEAFERAAAESLNGSATTTEDEPTPDDAPEEIESPPTPVVEVSLTEQAWAALRKAGAGKTAKLADSITWVIENVDADLGDIDPENVPDIASVSWLRQVQRDEGSRKSLFDKYMTTAAMREQKDDSDEPLNLEDRPEFKAIADYEKANPPPVFRCGREDCDAWCHRGDQFCGRCGRPVQEERPDNTESVCELGVTPAAP